MIEARTLTECYGSTTAAANLQPTADEVDHHSASLDTETTGVRAPSNDEGALA